jgi:hypothetical protein
VSLIQLFHDSAQSASHAFHSLSRQRENLEEKERGAFISSVRTNLLAEDDILFFIKVRASIEAVHVLCVRPLIPAAVTECHCLTVQSSKSTVF